MIGIEILDEAPAKKEKYRESYIEAQGTKHAKKLGLYVRKYNTPGHNGSPDRLYVDGEPGRIRRIFWIEYKATGEKPTKAQLEEHAVMRSFGMKVYWTDNVETAKAIMEGLFDDQG